MMSRKKRLIIIQLSLLLFGALIIIFTYAKRDKSETGEIIPKETQEKIEQQLTEKSEQSDIFFNIEYSGLDLAGNRYILKSKEASTKKESQEIVYMKFVEAVFYFKDGTVLNVISNEGTYNNKTLDMFFNGNLRANYQGSELFAEKAEYSNSGSFLSITENVRIKDIKGTMVADKLLFDIKKQTLNIASFNEGKVNAEVNIKWKKVLEF